jgi:Lrp/AsnC family leucine-responsive transcriptional regulator
MVAQTKIRHNPDTIDRKILALVQRDAALSQADIGKRVGLSAAAVNERIKKLERAKVIRRWTALVDAEAVGATVTAFIEVFIEHPKLEGGFVERISKLDEVLELHHVTGEFSLLLKVRVRDMQALKELLLNQLNAQEGVRQTRTVMVLSTHKEESFVATTLRGENP